MRADYRYAAAVNLIKSRQQIRKKFERHIRCCHAYGVLEVVDSDEITVLMKHS